MDEIVIYAYGGLYNALKAFIKDGKGVWDIEECTWLFFGKYLVDSVVYCFSFLQGEGTPAFEQQPVNFIVLIRDKIEFTLFVF